MYKLLKNIKVFENTKLHDILLASLYYYAPVWYSFIQQTK